MWLLCGKFPRTNWLRQIHPVMISVGGLFWASNNASFFSLTSRASVHSVRAVRQEAISRLLRKVSRLLTILILFSDVIGKYNYELSAALSSGIAIAAIVVFFGFQFPEVNFGGAPTSPI